MSDWMMFLGAGSSMAAPTNIPAFDPLRDAILEALGWEKKKDTYVHRKPIGGRKFPDLRSSRLSVRSAPPEVVFGTLHRFGVPFASQVERLLLEPRPDFNAVHAVAAAVLAGKGPVWTPNIDVAVEDAYQSQSHTGVRRVVVGERDESRRRLEFRADQVDDGVLFKVHGSADLPGSLAFTDLELLAPYNQDEIERLSDLARGRRLVFYGYRGADTDLRTLLEASVAKASEVVWYEPGPGTRTHIARAFGARVRFDPERLPSGDGSNWPMNLAATAEQFLAQADDAGLAPPGVQLRADLGSVGQRREIRISFDPKPPAIVQARLVERFGRTDQEKDALAAARRADLLSPHPRAVGAHIHWALSSSLYSRRGMLGSVVRSVAGHPTLSAALPSRLRTFMFDKGPALLLPSGRYKQLHDLSERALSLPERSDPLRRGSDLYYRAHSLRYLDRPEAARRDLDEAARLLVDSPGRADAERYAGVLLERGINAISRANPAEALSAADALVDGPGRYASGRWSGWGRWLRGMAYLYSLAVPGDIPNGDRLDAAAAEFHLACLDFSDSDLTAGLGDVYIGRLLVYRLQMACSRPGTEPQAPRLSHRQHQDQLLLFADIALANADINAALSHLDAVDRLHPSDLTASFARFARADIAHRSKLAGPSLAEIQSEAEAAGAYFLAGQAALGLSGKAETATANGQRVRAVGNPRVLWLLT
jgi:SIR2-like domain